MERTKTHKFLLLIGFLAVGLGIVTAYRNPATAFELSTYAETPLTFWLASCFGMLVSVFVVLFDRRQGTASLGAFLGGFSMTAIVSLPVIRGYHYLGFADSLSHFGTAVDMNDGLLPVTESIYPMVHILGSVLHDMTGLQLSHTFLILVVMFVILFFIFIPIVVRELTGNTEIAYIGLFSGLLLLPVNQLSPSIYIHPTSQALMYAPVVLFTFLALYSHRSVRNSALFLLTAIVFIFLHPQQAANLVIFFGIIGLAQIAFDMYDKTTAASWKNWVLPEVAVFTTLFLFWVQRFPAFWDSLETVYMIPFEETQTAETTVQRTGSLTEAGGSLPEVFLKLFFVSTVFLSLTTALIIYLYSRKYSERPSGTTEETVTPDGGWVQTKLLTVFAGFIGVSMSFVIYLTGGISDQYFRHLGMVMVLATILGSIAIARIASKLHEITTDWPDQTVRGVLAVSFVMFLALSIPVVFASPYIYDSSDHVTEMQMDGYETSFAYQANGTGFDNVRSETSRYGNAILGREVPDDAYYQRENPGIPDRFAERSLPAYYNDSTYVPVTESDTVRDAELWNGFRFSHDDFAYLDSEPNIDRVQTNGGYDLYLVTPDDAQQLPESVTEQQDQ